MSRSSTAELTLLPPLRARTPLAWIPRAAPADPPALERPALDPPSATESVIRSGTVVELTAADDNTARVVVQVDAKRLVARRAVSCLVAPAVGDRVLLVANDELCFVLAVLERETPSEPVSLVVEGGDASLRVPDGKLRLEASGGLDLLTGGALRFLAERVRGSAEEAMLAIRHVHAAGDSLGLEWGIATHTVGLLDQVVTRWTQRAKRVFRTVEEIEQLRARSVDLDAEETMRMRSQNTLMTADNLVRIDGDQIQMG